MVNAIDIGNKLGISNYDNALQQIIICNYAAYILLFKYHMVETGGQTRREGDIDENLKHALKKGFGFHVQAGIPYAGQ